MSTITVTQLAPATISGSTPSLAERDLAMFAKLRIPRELLAEARVRRVTDREAREDYGMQGPPSHDMSGVVYPYFSHVNGRRVTARVRRDNPEIENGRLQGKYISPYGDRRHLFVPPGTWAKLQSQETGIVLVESEKASLALTAWARRTGTDLLPIAMGGCWGWRGRIGKADGIDGGRVDVEGPLPDLDVCDRRTVYILLDANAATNPKVQQARAALVRELCKPERECTVLICDLPQADGINGPDDYLAANDDAAMGTVLANARDAKDEQPGYSDSDLALRFTQEHGDNLCYTAAWGRWNRWDGCRWQADDTLAVFDLARAVCRAAAAECDHKSTAQRVNSAATIAAVERLARADRRHAATVEQWDSDPWLLNTPAGTVNLRTGALRPSDRLDYCTKLTGAAPGGDCPLWRQFLKTVTANDDELAAYLQRVCGYLLTGSTQAHALFFLYGTGANGKSVFVSTISGILGDYVKVAPIESFTASQNESHPTDLAALQGSRLVTAVETEDGRRWAESKVKSLTGGDRIAARFMRQDFFEYLPQFKLVIAGNHKPGLRTVDEAVRRRFHLIPFAVTIARADRDEQLSEKLQAEWPGILAWMIDGCLRWQRDGLNPPPVVVDATESYMNDEDAFGLWIGERCESDPNSFQTTKALFDDWKEWAQGTGEFAGSRRRFAQNLETKAGIVAVRTKSARGFRGVKLRNGVR